MGRVSDAKERLMKSVVELIWIGSYGSTTIDQICEKAGVKKGSFYYFFEGKADLALAAISSEWQTYRAKKDAIFSSTVPPLERLRQHCELLYEEQTRLQKQYGYVLGCPLCSLGCEVSTQENALRKLVEEIMDQARSYLETAIRDAHAASVIEAPNAPAKARILYAYYEGLLTQARIQNNLEILGEMLPGTYEILGVKSSKSGTGHESNAFIGVFD
jgi:TetR/AcrR family transcriptional repressor of nem operon